MEIVIGGWYNSQSVIRRGMQGSKWEAQVSTPNILHCRYSKVLVGEGKRGDAVSQITNKDHKADPRYIKNRQYSSSQIYYSKRGLFMVIAFDPFTFNLGLIKRLVK